MPVPRTRVFLVAYPGNGFWHILRALLAELPAVETVGDAITAPDALHQLAALPAGPDVLLVSALVTQTPSLERFHQTLVDSAHAPTVAYFSPSYDAAVDRLRWDLDVLSYLCWDELGVADQRSYVPRLLRGAILALVHGCPVQSPSVVCAAHLAAGALLRGPAAATQSLSAREQLVLDLLMRGASDKAIAHQLGITISTVGNHVANLCVKLGVRSRVQLGAQAARLAASAPSSHAVAISLPAWKDRYHTLSDLSTSSASAVENAP
jgi:DNA-binding NarL/FixJ family response regulator